MNALIPSRTGALARSHPQFTRRLSLFTKTVGKELIGAEIDEAIEWCEIYGANPFTRDIYFFVFGKVGTDERRVVPVLSIGLYRKIAARSGRYRPDDKAGRFRYDETLKGPANPKGIIDCEVSVYQFSHGTWHPVMGHVRWDERAPIIEGGEGGSKWEEIPGEVWPAGHKFAGKPKVKRVPIGDVIVQLDPKKKNWHTMPETMLEKCAEAAAIRKGWPNETAGSYVEGELDAAHTIELTATEIVSQAEREQRFEKIGGSNVIMIDWLDGEALQPVPAGKFFDQANGFIRKHMAPGNEEAAHILQWRDRNKHSINQFWALEKDAALALKKELEKVETSIKEEPAKEGKK